MRTICINCCVVRHDSTRRLIFISFGMINRYINSSLGSGRCLHEQIKSKRFYRRFLYKCLKYVPIRGIDYYVNCGCRMVSTLDSGILHCKFEPNIFFIWFQYSLYILSKLLARIVHANRDFCVFTRLWSYLWRHLRKRTLLRKKYHRPWSDAAHDERCLIRACDICR